MKKYIVESVVEKRTIFESDSLKAVADFCNSLNVDKAYIKTNGDGLREWYSHSTVVFPNDFIIREQSLAKEAFESYLIIASQELKNSLDEGEILYYFFEATMNDLWFNAIDRGLRPVIASIVLGGWKPTKYIPAHPELFPLWNEIAHVGPCGRGF